MYIYKFEKGTIKMGVPAIKDEDYNYFEDKFGNFIKSYNDSEYSKDKLEPTYVFRETLKDENNDKDLRLILVRDKDRVIELELSSEYELADIAYVEAVAKEKPINLFCADGLYTWIEEKYIQDGIKHSWNGYVEII